MKREINSISNNIKYSLSSTSLNQIIILRQGIYTIYYNYQQDYCVAVNAIKHLTLPVVLHLTL
jgi:hypothetical protein